MNGQLKFSRMAFTKERVFRISHLRDGRSVKQQGRAVKHPIEEWSASDVRLSPGFSAV